MSLIQWNDSLIVNIAEIDSQHKRLVEMINDLYEAMRQGKGKEITGDVVKGLVAYASSHFKLEEKYFAQFNYPDSANHKSEHNAFVKRITDFQEKFNKGTMGLSVEIMKFLSDWLTNHIKVSDRKYCPFLVSKGIK